MFSLFILDHIGWWTDLGNLLKYTLIGAVIVVGAMLFRKSSDLYFGLGWLIVIPLPLATISVVERSFGSRAIFNHPSHEDIFIYGWLGIALMEMFFVWIPLAGSLLRRSRESQESFDGENSV